MSIHDAPRDRPAADDGPTTGGKGTPAPVEISTGRRATTTIALFLAGPVIWSVHFMLVYLVVEAGCTGDGPGLDAFDPPVPTVVTHAATAVAALACLATAGWAYRRWRTDQRTGNGSLAFAGFLLSLLGFVSVLFVGLPAAALPACGP